MKTLTKIAAATVIGMSVLSSAVQATPAHVTAPNENRPYYAQITCVAHGNMQVDTVPCFYHNRVGSEIIVRNGNKQPEVYRFDPRNQNWPFRPGSLILRLENSFHLTAQNVHPSLEVKVIIREAKTGNIVFEQNAGKYQTVSVRN